MISFVYINVIGESCFSFFFKFFIDFFSETPVWKNITKKFKENKA